MPYKYIDLYANCMQGQKERGLQESCKPLILSGAENEVRTRDPQLGKLMLYRLSYFRIGISAQR